MLPETKHKTKHGKWLKMLILKQMLQRLQIALVQVKVGNTSENVLQKISQIIFFILNKRNS